MTLNLLDDPIGDAESVGICSGALPKGMLAITGEIPPSSAGWITLLAKKIGGGRGPCNSNADGLARSTEKD